MFQLKNIVIETILKKRCLKDHHEIKYDILSFEI